MLDGTVLAMTFDNVDPCSWVFLYAYTGTDLDDVIAVGWARVDETRTVRADVGALPGGEHKLAAVAEDGQLLGWVAATLGDAPGTTVRAVTGQNRQEAGPVAEASTDGPIQLWPADLWLLGGGAVLAAGLVTASMLINRKRKV